MPNPYFQFKQFTVWHDKCAMKVGTDGVLLGAWTEVRNARRVLDIGTGTGLVALMLAQRCVEDALIVGLEIDESAVMQARENIAHSPWKDRMLVVQSDFKEYSSTEKYDVIVCNPPYFVDSLVCPDSQRNTARHNDALTYHDLLRGVLGLLADDGTFTLVIPADMGDRVEEIASGYHLYPKRRLSVVTKPGAEPKRVLIAFTSAMQECEADVLLVEVDRHKYSDEFVALAKDYYLHL